MSKRPLYVLIAIIAVLAGVLGGVGRHLLRQARRPVIATTAAELAQAPARAFVRVEGDVVPGSFARVDGDRNPCLFQLVGQPALVVVADPCRKAPSGSVELVGMLYRRGDYAGLGFANRGMPGLAIEQYASSSGGDALTHVLRVGETPDDKRTGAVIAIAFAGLLGLSALLLGLLTAVGVLPRPRRE